MRELGANPSKKQCMVMKHKNSIICSSFPLKATETSNIMERSNVGELRPRAEAKAQANTLENIHRSAFKIVLLYV